MHARNGEYPQDMIENVKTVFLLCQIKAITNSLSSQFVRKTPVIVGQV
jgi:hypothetical protein